MGISSKKKTMTQTVTPTAPDWIKTPYQNYATSVGNFASMTPQATPASALQTQAFKQAGALGQNPILANTQKYLNPYTKNVIDASMGDLNRGRQMQITNDQARATAAGAFGGSRHGVADSLTNDEYFRDAGSMASNLRMQGYENAQNAALQDYGANLQGITTRAGLGDQQRSIMQDANPYNMMLKKLQAEGGLLQGMNPQLFTGQTSNTVQKTSGGGLGQVLGGLGTLAMGLGTGGLGLTAGGLFGGLGAAGGASGFVPGWASGVSKGLM